MIAFPAWVRVWIAGDVTDMRSGMSSLFGFGTLFRRRQKARARAVS